MTGADVRDRREPPVGECPRCGDDIPRTGLLVEYETAGAAEMFAECPACEGVVHPE